MTTISKMLVIAVATTTLALGAKTASADHYYKSCGPRYGGYASCYAAPYYSSVYAPAPVVYAAPAYSYHRPVTYVRPAYYPAPRYYAAPAYRPYYAPARWGFGFGYGHGGHHGGHHHGGGFSFYLGG